MLARAPRTPTLLALALATTLGLGLGLTGCGGDSDATADPPATAGPSPSATSSPSPTRAPTEAPPGETARQFIERWNVTETTMENTGQSSAYRAMTLGCKPCRTTAAQIDSIYGAGGRIQSQGRRILFIRPLPSAEGYTVFRVGFDVGKTSYVERSGAESQSFPGGRRVYQFELTRAANSWRLTNLYVVAS